MTASELIQVLIARGLARATQPGPGATHAVVAAGIEVAVTTQATERQLRALWRERVGSTATPYLLMADEPAPIGSVSVLGPTSREGPVRSVNVSALLDVVEQAAAQTPLDAIRHVAGELDRLDQTGIPGLKVRGLLTLHTLDIRLRRDASRLGRASELIKGVTQTDDWRSVLTALGYSVDRRPLRGYLARFDGRPVAVIHPKTHPADFTQMGADGRPPQGTLLADCHADGAAFGIMAYRGRFRLMDTGVPSSVVSSFVDIDAELLQPDDRAFLALLCPEYLAEGGFRRLEQEAHDWGSALRRRLDTTLRDAVLPSIAAALHRWAPTAGINPSNDESRRELERASLTLIFRLLFLLYAESAGYLPMDNRTYRNHSITALVEEASDTLTELGDRSTALWSRFVTLVSAMRTSNPAWGVPAYNGALFADHGFEGATTLEQMTLTDREFGPVLVGLGRDPETRQGVDYSTLEIGHLGHIYEGLLSLRLSIADRPLRYDPAKDRYLPARQREAELPAGALLWQTHEGGRKGGGVYYTRAELVRHLVRHAVLPAFEVHLHGVRDQARSDPAGAADKLFEFAVLDPACGSAHFLVEVLAGLADRLVVFLAETPLPAVAEALERLRAGSLPGATVSDVDVLRRLVLKRCVFGVDVSPMGAEVATVSLWLASFVPGLSLAYLGRNVVVGNSLLGVGRPEAVGQELRHGQASVLDDALKRELEQSAAAMAQLAAIEDRNPDEYQRSEEADLVAQAATAGLKRLFDLWTAEAFGVAGARHQVEVNGASIVAGEEVDYLPDASQIARKHSLLHWPLAFPMIFSRPRPGFDVVVGNPPWEQLRVERLEFFVMYQPGLQGLPEPEREAAITSLLKRRPELERAFEERQHQSDIEREALAQGEYEPMPGFPDLYKYFCQRYGTLVRQEGALGVVLPRTAFVNEGSAGFRKWLFERVTCRRIDFLLNRRLWMFETHPQYTVALVSAQRATPSDDHLVEVAGTAASVREWETQSAGPGLKIARPAFGPSWVTPLIRNQAEADLLAKVRVGSRFPFGPNGRWACFAIQELNETSDRDLWASGRGKRELWKGESFDQYDPHGAEARPIPSSQAVLAKVRKPRPGAGSAITEQVSLAERRAAVLDELEGARVAFRDVTNRTNSRTVLACLVPPGVFLTNKAPYLAFVNGDELTQAACLGIMNSLPFDWQARRFVEINLNFFLLEGLVVPELSDDDFAAVAKAAARLSTVDERFADYARAMDVDIGPLTTEERTLLRVEIDVRLAHAWGLRADELDVMLADFTTDAVSPHYRGALRSRLAELT